MRFTSFSLSLAAAISLAGCNKEKPNPAPPAAGTVSAPAANSSAPAGSISSPAPSVSTATPKADFTLTCNELAKESKADKRGFQRKFNGKSIELSGKIAYVNSFGDVGFTLRPDDVSAATLVNIELRKADQPRLEKMKAASRGQLMTVRGRMQASGDLLRIAEAELVQVGPTPALPATLEAIVAEVSKPEGQKKLSEAAHDIVLRVEVRGYKKEADSQQYMTVCDPGKADQTMEAHMQIVDGGEMKAWSEIKPGTIVILMAEGGFHFDGGKKTPMLRGARVLAAVPEGIKLPAAAK